MLIAAGDWAVAVPIIAAVVAASATFGYNLYLKRREEKRERYALVRLLDDELARVEGALEALIESARDVDSAKVRAAAKVAERTRSGTVWDQTKLDLARHLSFREWDLLRDVYVAIHASWLQGESLDLSETNEYASLTDELRAVFNAESVAPRLLRLIARAREVCSGHLGGVLPPKVALSATEASRAAED